MDSLTSPDLKMQRGERIICMAQRHWMVFVLRSWAPALVILGCLLVFWIRVSGREPDYLGRQPPLLDGLSLLLFLLILISAAIMVYVWVDWRSDHLIITNKRIVHEDRIPWVSYRYETIPLEQVQNVNVRMSNLLQNLLQYGRVKVQAAGPGSTIVFERAKCPDDIQRRIMDEVKRQKRQQEQQHINKTVERHVKGEGPPSLTAEPVDDSDVSENNIWLQVFPVAPIKDNGSIIWHRHWIILLRNLLWPMLALLVWLVALVALPSLGWFSPTVTVITLFVTLLLVLLYVFWQYEDWRNDVYILQPSKIIDVERLPFGLYEDRREASLGRIQNVNATTPHVVARLLGYGDVLIETAGSAGNFTFDHVPNPDDVQRIVFEYQDRYKWLQREREWDTTLSMIDVYLERRNGRNPI
jgi:uncharacterized membrane protein YdbT with pleckstrin-like domain